MGGTLIKLGHGGIRGVDVLLDHHVAQPGPRGIEDVAVIADHRHAMQTTFEEPNLQGKVGRLHRNWDGVVVHDKESPAAILNSLLATVDHQVQLLGGVGPANGRPRTR